MLDWMKGELGVEGAERMCLSPCHAITQPHLTSAPLQWEQYFGEKLGHELSHPTPFSCKMQEHPSPPPAEFWRCPQLQTTLISGSAEPLHLQLEPTGAAGNWHL